MTRPQIIGFEEDRPPNEDHPVRFWVLFGLACLGIAWFYAAPYITFYQLKDAAKRKDTEALSELVNFPTVKESIKETWRAGLAQHATKDKEGGFGAALGLLFGGFMIDSMVDLVISPSGLQALSRGQRPDFKNTKAPFGQPPTSGRSSTTAPSSEEPSSDELEQGTSFLEDVVNGIQGKTDMALGYDGLSKFSARWPDKATGQDAVVLILRRENVLWWRLTDIRMPILFDGAKK
jgi:hypothetical protein